MLEIAQHHSSLSANPKRRTSTRLVHMACALLAALAFTGVHISGAWAQSLIRDAEIEQVLRKWSNPIFAAAGLTPSSVRIFIVNDKALNAFVAGGQNLFINTGTLMQLDRPREVIGIIAHETGHIAGGHLARSSDAMAKATIPMVAGLLLGIAAMAAGAPDAGMAMIGGGQEMAMRSFLAYSREQESAADQAAVNYLNATRQSARGLLDTFRRFSGQEILSAERQDPFVRSHPISLDRMAALENRVEASDFANKSEPESQIKEFARIKAKLVGFLDRPDLVARYYPQSDQSIDARYARAIAAYRIPDLPTALSLMNGLIMDEPANPYFHELKGQILFENGRAGEAVPAYEAAVRYAPGEPLIMTGLGQALLATDDPKLNGRATKTLEAALAKDSDNPTGWHQLAIAYERAGQRGMAEYATAERMMSMGALPQARMHAARALCTLKTGTPAWRRAQDIVSTADITMTKEGKNASKRGRGNGAEMGPGCPGASGPSIHRS